MAKLNLPKDWILVTSTTEPGRNYYFNVATDKSTWIFPDDSDQSSQNTRKNVSKKRKKTAEHDSEKCYRPHTPEEDPDVEQRPKLVAKRKLSTAKGQKAADKPNTDTPQMKALREKMLQKQAKTSAIKKPRPLKSLTIKNSPIKDKDDKVTKVNKSPRRASRSLKFSDSDDDDEEEEKKNEDKGDDKGMTPMMKLMRQKIQERKSLSATPDKKRTKSSLKSQSARLSLTRNNKSMSDNTVSSSTTSISAATAEAEVKGIGSPRTRLNRSISSATASPRRRSSKIDVESKLKQIRTSEAPPGVSGKRVLVTDTEPTKSVDTVISPVSSAKIPRISKIKPVMSPESKDPPAVYKNAGERLEALRKSINSQGNSIDSLNFSGCSATTASDSGQNFCEEMDWEPSEEEKIVFEIQSVRAQLIIENDIQMQELNNPGLDLTDRVNREANDSMRKLYIVVDTNVFLSNLTAVEEARDAVFKFYNRPIIIVPWTVIRELDFIKDDRSQSRPASLKIKARQAIQFLNKLFATKHPRVLGQTFADVLSNRERFEAECPDDEILQTCLQIQSAGHHIVLLSYDKNLCNKAMIHDVISLGKNDPLEKVDYLKESEIKKRFSLADSLKEVEKDSRAESLLAEELFEDLKTTLTTFLSVIVTKEMKNLCGDNWERYVMIRPPWTALTVLKCADKHWIAAVSESFNRKAQHILKDLLETVKNLQLVCQLRDVENAIQHFHELVRYLKAEKYPNLLGNVTAAIEELKKRFQDDVKLIFNSTQNNKQQQEESKAVLAFEYFSNVYTFARNVCGTSAHLIGMPFSLDFQKFESSSIEDEIKQIRPDVAGNLNKLMQILSTALVDIEQLDAKHPYVQALHQILTGFLPEGLKSNKPLTPLDVYWCLKYKEEDLKRGLGQLEELSSYFCRMATFKCL